MAGLLDLLGIAARQGLRGSRFRPEELLGLQTGRAMDQGPPAVVTQQVARPGERERYMDLAGKRQGAMRTYEDWQAANPAAGPAEYLKQIAKREEYAHEAGQAAEQRKYAEARLGEQRAYGEGREAEQRRYDEAQRRGEVERTGRLREEDIAHRTAREDVEQRRYEGREIIDAYERMVAEQREKDRRGDRAMAELEEASERLSQAAERTAAEERRTVEARRGERVKATEASYARLFSRAYQAAAGLSNINTPMSERPALQSRVAAAVRAMNEERLKLKIYGIDLPEVTVDDVLGQVADDAGGASTPQAAGGWGSAVP